MNKLLSTICLLLGCTAQLDNQDEENKVESCSYIFKVRTGRAGSSSAKRDLRLFNKAGQVLDIVEFGRPTAKWRTNTVDSFSHSRTSCLSGIYKGKLSLRSMTSYWAFESLDIVIYKDTNASAVSHMFGVGDEISGESPSLFDLEEV